MASKKQENKFADKSLENLDKKRQAKFRRLLLLVIGSLVTGGTVSAILVAIATRG